MGTWGDSWTITRTAFRMIREDPALLAVPAIAGGVLLGIFLLFTLPLLALVLVSPATLLGGGGAVDLRIAIAALLIALYFVLVFVGNFFLAALVGMASMKMDGAQPTVSDGLRFARSRWKGLLVWSLIAATIGLIIQAVSSRVKGIEGMLIRVIAGATWGLATYFVIPVVVFENVSGFSALRRSWTVFRDSFGRTLVTNLVVGVITAGLVLAGVALLVIAIFLWFTGSVALGAGLLIGAVALLIFAAVLGAALEGIVRAALYRYAVTGKIADGLIHPSYLTKVPPPSVPPPPPPPPSRPPLPSSRTY